MSRKEEGGTQLEVVGSILDVDTPTRSQSESHTLYELPVGVPGQWFCHDVGHHLGSGNILDDGLIFVHQIVANVVILSLYVFCASSVLGVLR